MKKNFKFLLKRRAFKYSENYLDRIENGVIAYSQEGEDLLLAKLFGQKMKGFFVDVGAHHPKKYSNTYLFYKRGWRGINIDPLPGIMKEFEKERPGDINLELGISDTPGKLVYYMFQEPALNTFSKEVADGRVREKEGVVDSTKEIEVKKLEDVLNEKLSPGQKIDLLSIDVEGFDLQVLYSNNWQKYRPYVVIVECLGFAIEDLLKSEVYGFMKKNEYSFFAKTVGSVFFIDQKNNG